MLHGMGHKVGNQETWVISIWDQTCSVALGKSHDLSVPSITATNGANVLHIVSVAILELYCLPPPKSLLSQGQYNMGTVR